MVTSPSPGDPEFLKTPFGGTFLVFESFLYRREKVAGDKVYWTCRDQARRGCRSRAITQGLRVMVMRRHCHPPDLGGLEELRDRDNFPRLAQTEDSGEYALPAITPTGPFLLPASPMPPTPHPWGAPKSSSASALLWAEKRGARGQQELVMSRLTWVSQNFLPSPLPPEHPAVSMKPLQASRRKVGLGS